MKSALKRVVPLAVSMSIICTTMAHAHAVLEKRATPIGQGYKAVIKITHGCEGSPTLKVTVEIPEGVIGIKPMPKSGWEISMTKGKYAQDYAFYHGKKMGEGVKSITWTGSLPDEYYDEFTFNGFIAGELKPGESLPFFVTQDCAKGQLRWREIAPDGHAHHVEYPAPLLKLLPKANAE